MTVTLNLLQDDETISEIEELSSSRSIISHDDEASS